MSKTEISKQISSNKQASHGVRRSSVCIIGLALFLALAPSVARAQGAAARAACTLDAFRLCGAEITNVERIIACMKANCEPEPWLQGLTRRASCRGLPRSPESTSAPIRSRWREPGKMRGPGPK